MMSTDNTIQLVSLALDAALMRQTTIANNIANINTENYQSMEVNFEQQLQENHLSPNNNDLSEITPYYQSCDHQSSIDEQMTLNVQNMTHYRALVKGLNQKLAIMKLALQGNQ
jgi:flagellar basal-body rod protein FlgB